MNNMKHIIFLILLFGSCSNLFGQAKLDQLRQKLLRAPVQEKVYLPSTTSAISLATRCGTRPT